MLWRTCFILYPKVVVGLAKLVTCLVVIVLLTIFLGFFLVVDWRFKIGHGCCSFGFLVARYLWFATPLLKWILQVSRMVRFWKERILEREWKREIEKSRIHTLDLWHHLQVKLSKLGWLMSSIAPGGWIFGWGTRWGLSNLGWSSSLLKCYLLFNIFYENNFNFKNVELNFFN
jgi:hypothetical protein